MNELPFYFQVGESQRFGLLHLPTGAVRGAYVFCHPFAEEKLWAHRVYVSLARRFAERGYAVLRFDFNGHGDSDGRFADADLESYIGDVWHAVDEIARRAPNVRYGLFGLRLGGALAALAAERDSRIAELVLWEPTANGAQYGQEILLTNLATQMAAFGKVRTERKDLVRQMEAGGTVNIDGYEMSHAMYRQITEIDLVRGAERFRGRCLIVQIDRGPRPPRKELQQLASSFDAAQLVQCIEQPFWKEIKEYYGRAERLTALTLQWLESSDDGASTPTARSGGEA